MKSAIRSIGRVFGVVVCVLTFSLATIAAPPPNDLCSGAEQIPGAGPFPFFSNTNSLLEATAAGDPPRPTNCFSGEISRSLWYQFTPATSGVYTVSTKDNGTRVVDTLLGIYTSPAGCTGPFQLLSCNDDSGLSEQVLRAAITANFDAGITYHIVVWSTLTNTPIASEADVQLTVQKVAVPSNDNCTGAEIIPNSVTGVYLTSVKDTYLATTVNDPPSPPCQTAGARSVWYKFTPDTSGAYIFSTCTNGTQTRIYDTLLAVYTASAGCGSVFTPVTCNDNFCGFSASLTVPNMTAGTDYYIVVWDMEVEEALAGETEVQLQVVRQGAPLVTTLAVSSLTSTGVVLNATANPRGLLTRGFFQYGATTNLGSTTISNILGNGSADVFFSRLVAPLVPGTTNYYRAGAVNSQGTRFGEILSFVVPAAPPQFTSVRMEAGGLRVEFTGTPGFVHTVQGSDDLKEWTNLGTATSAGGNRYVYLDAGALTRSYRFYRIRL